MSLNSKYLGTAAGITAAISYAVCALAVAIAPGATTRVFGYVMHIDLSAMSRSLTWTSFLVGMIVFSVTVGILVGITASLCRRLSERMESPVTVGNTASRPAGVRT